MLTFLTLWQQTQWPIILMLQLTETMCCSRLQVDGDHALDEGKHAAMHLRCVQLLSLVPAALARASIAFNSNAGYAQNVPVCAAVIS